MLLLLQTDSTHTHRHYHSSHTHTWPAAACQFIEAALQAEDQALTTIHVAVNKQLHRLEVGCI